LTSDDRENTDFPADFHSIHPTVVTFGISSTFPRLQSKYFPINFFPFSNLLTASASIKYINRHHLALKIATDGSKYTRSCVTYEREARKRRMKDLNTLTIKKKSSKERVERRKRKKNWSSKYESRRSPTHTSSSDRGKQFSSPWFGNSSAHERT
jgi:hypothetical protein